MVATLSRIDGSRPPKFSLFTEQFGPDLSVNEPQYIKESQPSTNRRTHYRITGRVMNFDTRSKWESLVGVAK